MKKLIFTMLFVLLPFFCFAEEWFDYNADWCLEASTQEYCLNFTALPFGPGLNMEVELTVTPLNPIFSPVQIEVIEFGLATQRFPGALLTFTELPGWFARTSEGQLELYQDFLLFNKVE